MSKESDIKRIEDMLYAFLKNKTPTHTEVVERVKEFCELYADNKDEMDQEIQDQIVEYVETNISIRCAESISLVSESVLEQSWMSPESYNYHLNSAFGRYVQYLSDKRFPPKAIEEIEKNCKQILSFSANPNSKEPVKRFGLAVGDVQSGKTANYTALINMACDNGYKIIVLLAGMTNLLRIQTQERIDEGFIGAKSETISSGNVEIIGVGSEEDKYYAIPLTNSKNDFVKFIKQNLNSTPSDYSKPLILVVKKNARVLEQVQEWLKPGKNEIQSQNILLIDDEADNASVNSKKSDDNPTKINHAIRLLLSNFTVATYVGFTATPFANIFINPDNDKELQDLFPRDFIVLLSEPSTYFGSKKVFKSDRHLRILDENEPGFLSVTHKRTASFNILPESLKEAVCAFLLGCVIRTLRNQKTDHRSMLINISRFNPLQTDIGLLVEEYVDDLKNLLCQESYKKTKDFIKSEEASRLYELYTNSKYFEHAREKFNFDAIKTLLMDEIKQFKIAIMNDENVKNRFNYHTYDEVGARVIVIGGFILSRGLTLEGLMVSYYSRNASAYDSLLQMCRWFGYRSGYEDLCIIYLSQISRDCFGAVVDAVDDLKFQFKIMARRNKTPLEFGLMVKESPKVLATTSWLKKTQEIKVLKAREKRLSSLSATSKNKMQYSHTVDFYLSYGGEVIDTHNIPMDLTCNKENIEICHKLFSTLTEKKYHLSRISTKEKRNARLMYKNVTKDIIAEFVSSMRVHESNATFNVLSLFEFIEKSQQFPVWDILIAEGDSNKKWTFGNQTINVTRRTCLIREGENFIRTSKHNNRLINPNLLSSGLSKEELEQVKKNAEDKTLTSVDFLNIDTRNPLLIIHPVDFTFDSPEKEKVSIDEFIYMGFALAFPGRGKTEKVKYRINEIKYRELANNRLLDDSMCM